MGKSLWIKKYFTINYNSNFIFNFSSCRKWKNVSLVFFFFSFIASSLFFSFNFLQLRSRREWKWIEREETAKRRWWWSFLCSVLLFLLNQIGKRNGREEGTKLIESRRREVDNKESMKFYGMINGEKNYVDCFCLFLKVWCG